MGAKTAAPNGNALEAVLKDRVSGASEIEMKVLECLAELPEGKVSEVLLELPERLRGAFPEMANVARLAGELRAFRENGARVDGRERACSFPTLIARIAREQAARVKSLSGALAPLLPAGDLLVFTLSKSGTVATVLGDLQASGRRVSVLIAESRPGGEGLSMARELVGRGLKTRVLDDFLFLSLIPPEAASRRPAGFAGPPVVLVGADAVHPDGIINKVGTRALLDSARQGGVPAFVLVSSSKVRSEKRPGTLGSIFESVPLDAARVVSEEGPMEGEGLTHGAVRAASA